MKVLVVLEGVLLSLYFVQYVYSMKKYKNKFQMSLKILLTMFLTCILGIAITRTIIWYQSKDLPLREEINLAGVQGTAVKFFHTGCLLLMFKLLFLIKRVEIQLNPKFKTFQQILRQVNIMICLERVFLLTLLLMYPCMLLITKLGVNQHKQSSEASEALNIALITYYTFCIMFLIINVGGMIWLGRTAWFLIDVHEKDANLNGFRAKLLITLVFTLVSFSIFTQYIFSNVVTIVCYLDGYDGNSYGQMCQALWSDVALIIYRVFRYQSFLTPFMIASYMTFVLSYVASVQAEDDERDDDEEFEDKSYLGFSDK